MSLSVMSPRKQASKRSRAAPGAPPEAAGPAGMAAVMPQAPVKSGGLRPPKLVPERAGLPRPRTGPPFNLREVVGNVTLTGTSATAWFVMEPKSVSFRPDAEVERLIDSGGAALADLVGMRLYFRLTTRPVAVEEIADRTWGDAVGHTAGPLPGALDMVRREQERLWGADLTEKFVFLGVRVATARRHRDARREVARLAATLEKVTRVAARHGLSARRATEAEMDLLLRRSFALSLPLPRRDSHVLGDWETDDLPDLAGEVTVTTPPFAKIAEVSGWDDRGRAVSSHVAVLVMGRVGRMDVPNDGRGGWLHRADRLTFPVEVMATFDVLSDERVSGQVRHQIDVIADQYRHYTVEHGKPAPRALARQNDHALRVEEELSAGLGGLATRTDGWVRMAVWGRSEEEVRERVEAVRSLYGAAVEWRWPSGQVALVREFVPGEPLANTGNRRRFTAPSVMAALPSATAEIGDGYGALIGETAGTTVKPVLLAFWADMEERNRSGLLVLTGGLGSGKSVTGGLIVYETAMMGSRWVVFDPSGRLAKLCDLPELRDHSRHTNLLQGRAGELSPYRVLADPRPEHYRDRRQSDPQNRQDWEEAMSQVRAQRVTLCLDVLTSLLPKALRDDGRALSVLRAAVSAVSGERSSSPSSVLDELGRIGRGGPTDLEWTPDHRIAARDIRTELEMFAGTPKGRLVFGEAPVPDEEQDGRILLHVYSLHGLQIPTAGQLAQGAETANSRQSKALFNLAAWLTQQSIYLGDPRERKGLFIDEAHMLSQFEEGAALIEKSAVDSRKHNTRVILCSQNVNHFDVDRIAPLASMVMVGRTTDENAARDALKLCGLSVEQSYVDTLGGLTQVRPGGSDHAPHEFLLSTKDLGQYELVRVYGDEHPHVMEALDTTPNRVAGPPPEEKTDEETSWDWPALGG